MTPIRMRNQLARLRTMLITMIITMIITMLLIQCVKTNIKLSKSLIIIDEMLVDLNGVVTVTSSHEHNDQHLKCVPHYLENIIDSTNDKLSKL